MQNKSDKYKNLLDANNNPIKIVILGQDPYPRGAMGIAFCKNEFDDLFDNHCSGKHILKSLGITTQNTRSFEMPEDIFYYLLRNGIAVLNISNSILEGKFIKGQTKSEFNRKLFINNEKIILEAKEYNIPFIQKAEKIVLLGKWKTEPIFMKYYSEYKSYKTLIHPSNYNTKEISKKKEWEKIYGQKYLLNLIKK